MGKEVAGTGIQGGDFCDVVYIELEIEDGQVLNHALLTHGLGKCHDAELHNPAQDDLANSSFVFLGDRLQQRILK